MNNFLKFYNQSNSPSVHHYGRDSCSDNELGFEDRDIQNILNIYQNMIITRLFVCVW